MTGTLVHGRDHVAKAKNSINRLYNIIKREDLNAQDTRTALDLIDNLKDAIYDDI